MYLNWNHAFIYTLLLFGNQNEINSSVPNNIRQELKEHQLCSTGPELYSVTVDCTVIVEKQPKEQNKEKDWGCENTPKRASHL